MAFKREGDDVSQLRVLQKRRVSDLLANYIPEDEALLLRTGRYACTVCFHRPVFDTLDMLTVHRTGKKHIASLQTFYGRKCSRENELQKRQQQEFLQVEETGTPGPPCPAPLLTQTRAIAQSALLKAPPYSSCCRRNRCDGSRVGAQPGPGLRPGDGQAPPGSSSSQPQGEEGGVTVDTTPVVLLPGLSRQATDAQQDAASRPKGSGKGKAPPTPSQLDPVSPERRRELEYYLLLRSSGWIQDPSGKWVKDENVEFDSDEDEPPAPTPP
ncbi:PREDICTED: sodium channel modifier 1 [Crocodylus porosus]|uniref:Sodium channel modifier 1 n=1 Tax=Crocodylus porosus TaxID=8502 RepID=A0A7M4EJ63_CROPO|nr:PREDICTED: sodium channel modifier 1 [Crocodylus porosus]